MHRLRALLVKEFRQMLREPRSVALGFVVPLALLLLFGYAISFDIREVRTIIWDRDATASSRALIRSFVSSGYFREAARAGSEADVSRALDSGKASMALTIPRGFGRALARGTPAEIQVLVDGSDSSNASVIQGHARHIAQTFAAARIAERLRASGAPVPMPIDFRPRVLYNQELKSRNFMVPGLIGVLLTILGVVQTSLSIAREKDRGTLDQLRVTPLRAWEILVGKMLPHAAVAMANAWLALGVGHFLMGVPVRGSLWLFLGGTILFLASSLGVGLTISALTSTQQGAQAAAFLGSLLPVFYLSDFMFPIRSMPAALQAVTYAIPARYYVTVLRGTLQKGVGAVELSGSLAALAAYAAAIGLVGLIAIRRAFR